MPRREVLVKTHLGGRALRIIQIHETDVRCLRTTVLSDVYVQETLAVISCTL